jgi:hypothetical protein
MTISSNVVSKTVNGEEVILNLADGVYYGLDEVGTRFWQHLQEGRTLPEATQLMLSDYDVDEQTLQADLGLLLTALEEHGLVVRA